MTILDPFFGTTGPRDARIMIVGEAWGAEELNQRRPFVGESGRELDKMLAEAKIDRKDCLCANIVDDKPRNNDLFHWFYPSSEVKAQKLVATHNLFPHKKVLDGIDKLLRLVDLVKPDLIIGCGNYPLWVFTDLARITNHSDHQKQTGWKGKVPRGITELRGSQFLTTRGRPGIKYLPIIHPAAVIRNWPYRPTVVHDLRVRVPLALANTWTKPQQNTLAPPTALETTRYLSDLYVKLCRAQVDLVVDLETRSKRVITCVGLLTDDLKAISIPFLKITGDKIEPYWPIDVEKQIVRLLALCLNHPNVFLIGQNFLYDMQFMHRWWGIRPRDGRVFDTMVAQHVMFPGTPKALWYLASLYARKFYAFWKDDSKEWEAGGDLRTHLLYNCDDLFYTRTVWLAQRDALVRMQLIEQFNFKMLEWMLAFEMMTTGFRIDEKVRTAMTLQVATAAAHRQQWLNKVVPAWVRPETKRGAKPWYSSAKQQMELFYKQLGLKSVPHRKTGNPTADDTALIEIKLRYPELGRVVDTIAELRSLGVFQNNFLAAPLDPDSRIRCSFNVAGPETFRWSSSENAFGRGTNLQNIPKGVVRKGR